MTYDLAIIGAGPGGYVAAIRGARLGMKTALIEKERVGGTCLNRGCIPTKSIIAAAERILDMAEISEMGIEGVDISRAKVNLAMVMERKERIVSGLSKGILQLLKSNKVDYIAGAAQFVSPTELKIEGSADHKSLVTNHCIIATGSVWSPLPGIEADGNFIVNSDHMLEMKELPKRLVIIGGGAVGSEFASVMNAFGVEVCIVEIAEQILPLEDVSVARMLASLFKKRGIKIYTKTTVGSVKPGVVSLSTGEDITADKVLVSVGRRPYSGGLNLEAAGIETKNGFILTDEKMRTNVPGIFAVGDVAAPRGADAKPALAHIASKEGITAVTNIANAAGGRRPAVIDYSVVPRPIFTIPEIVSVGLTERELKAGGRKYRRGRFSYAALSKAVCDGATDGIMQVYIGEDGMILGAHCMGRHASDICAEASLAMCNNLTIADVVKTIHAHPTYSEAMVEALEDAEGMAVHKGRG